MKQSPTPSQILLARTVLALIAVFLAAGLIIYGFSAEVRARIWHNLIERPDGPMLFRFFLQPTMVALVAWRDGLADARAGRTPFVFGAADPVERVSRLDEAVVATARIILLGLVMDTIYQVIEFKTFFPAEAVLIALALALLPYIVLRGIFHRIARRWLAGRAGGAGR